MKMKKLIIGNWKMNPQTRAEAFKIFTAVSKEAADAKKTDVALCVPAVYLSDLSNTFAKSKCVLGSQDVSFEKEGAFTGEISPKMLASLKAKYVIIGHSERRALGESDALVSKKILSALEEGLTVILCVGEKIRDEECTFLQTLKEQIEHSLSGIAESMLAKIVIAYEPIWAIGEKAKGSIDATALFETTIFIRKVLSGIYSQTSAHAMRILYGGSVDETNAEAFLRDGGCIGLLVGRASTDPKRFNQIIKIAEKI